MSSARDKVLASIRSAIGGSGSEASRLEAARARIAEHPRQIEPVFDEPLQHRFQVKLEAAQASFAAVANVTAAAGEIERYLDAMGLDRKLVCGMDEMLSDIAWPDTIEAGRWEGGADYLAGVARAFCGIAETGTLALLSGEKHPTSLNFLPDYHIVLLKAEDLLPRMEDAWDRIRESHGRLPRTVNFISGPSKTADIEQTVEYGAHGPRCLHVILVG